MSNPLFDSPLTQLAIDRNNLTAAIVAILSRRYRQRDLYLLI